MNSYLTREHLPHRFVSAIMFAAASMLIVSQGADVYYRYIDRTQYFKVEQPVIVDKLDYKPCDRIIVNLVRSALIDARAVSTVEIMLVNAENGAEVRRKVGGDEFNFTKGNAQLTLVPFNIPCDIDAGQYRLRAIVDYKVNGIEKSYRWESQEFNVIALSN